MFVEYTVITRWFLRFYNENVFASLQLFIELQGFLCFFEYTDLFCNPMLMWGSYRRGFFRTTLPISFQFHHVQMDGSHAARFLELLQAIIIAI